VCLAVAKVAEVVEIKCPDHGTGESHLLDVVCLVFDHFLVVKRHPLITQISVGSHAAQLILDHFPAVLLDSLTDLKRIGRYI
jgi:hypothetical protein